MSLLIPEVFADAINAKLDTTIRIGRVAFDATSLVPDILVARDTVHFPTFNRVAVAESVTKGTELTPKVVDMTDAQAPIKWIGSAVRIFDAEAAQIKGAVVDQMAIQVAEAMAKKIDNDLTIALDTDIAYKAAAAAGDAITAKELEGGFAKFGDNVDTAGFAGIIINSRLLPSFYAMPEFTSTQLTYQTDGNGIVTNGIIGLYRGIPVIVCDNGTFETGKSEFKTYIVKTGALGYVFQRNIKIEEDRQGLLLATDIIASSLYATKLIDSTGAVVIRKTIV